MSEYQRSANRAGTIYQWVDSETVMVLDAVTGKPERFGPSMNATGSLQDALAYVAVRKGWEGRMVIVRLSGIRAYRIADRETDDAV